LNGVPTPTWCRRPLGSAGPDPCGRGAKILDAPRVGGSTGQLRNVPCLGATCPAGEESLKVGVDKRTAVSRIVFGLGKGSLANDT
jgi:hypothetical protein